MFIGSGIMPPSKSHKSSSSQAEGQSKSFDQNFGLSDQELKRYESLNPPVQAQIMDKLRERNRLNDFVKDYLQEEIHKQFGAIMQLFFPSEHSLKYALQKVDEIELIINDQLPDDIYLFDEETTKKNRLDMLLNAACAYQQLLEKKIARFERALVKLDILHHHKEKHQMLMLIIDELKQQRDHSEFYIHNQDLLEIDDTELNSFLNKLKAIGIGGFTPTATKEASTLTKISFFSAIYEKFIPNLSEGNPDQRTADKSDESSSTKRRKQ